MPEYEAEDIVEFNPIEKLIKIKPAAIRPDGNLILDAQRDIYSAARSWEASSIGIVYPEIVKAEGGNILPGGVKMPLHIILLDGWKIQCPNNCDNVEIYGSLLSVDNKPTFVSRPDGHRITYNEINKIKTKEYGWVFILSVLLLLGAEAFIAKWILDKPAEMEPYSAFLVVLFTIIQLATQARKP